MVRSPDATFSAGTCLQDAEPRIRVLRLDATSKICLRDEVNAWLAVEFSPPVDCGDALGLCPLRMNIFAPSSRGPWPLVVLAPGGPATLADQFYLDAYAALLASHGLVVMESSWRQLDFHGSGYPAAFADISCAIGVARRTGGTFGADPDRVTLVGHSLGGWAASVLLLTPGEFSPAAGSSDPTIGSSRPNAVVVVAGSMNQPTTTVPDETDYVRTFLGLDSSASPDEWAAVDPYALARLHLAGPDSIPTTIIAAGPDQMVPIEVARTFQDVLVASGYQSRLIEIPAADHLSVLIADETLETVSNVARGR